MKKTLKKGLLIGIGLTSLTAKKAKKITDKLVKNNKINNIKPLTNSEHKINFSIDSKTQKEYI